MGFFNTQVICNWVLQNNSVLKMNWNKSNMIFASPPRELIQMEKMELEESDLTHFAKYMVGECRGRKQFHHLEQEDRSEHVQFLAVILAAV